MDQNYDLRYLDEVKRYIPLINFIKSPFQVEEISNGNMNYVYKIKECDSGKTFILKYAAKHTRISENILVSTDRIKIEANVLQKLGILVPDFVPHIFHYDDINKCIIMEECEGYSVMRESLNQYHMVIDFSEKITSYLVKSIISTLVSTEEPETEELFTNPLCEITKVFVFTEPFDPNGGTNAIFEPNQEYVQREVYSDLILLDHIQIMKKKFIEKKQALIHGDLHTGSIFMNDSSVIIFDYEFAYYGPIGFDIGNLIANLVFAWLHAKVRDVNQNKGFINWIEITIIEIIDKFRVKFKNELIGMLHSENKKVIIDIDEVIHETASFAGVELLRRVIGIAHVSDILSIESETLRIRAERVAMKLAKEYILGNKTFNIGKDFVNALKRNYENSG